MIVNVAGRQRPAAGGAVHGAVVLVMLLVIAALALVVTPPSPPGIAEFAPKATETIDDALKQQASQFGTGEGGDCGAGQRCAVGGDGVATTTSTTNAIDAGRPPRRVIEQARVKRCVGDPPRQTEDPQSPPCANYWEGDNGGATATGVTGQEIRVAVKQATLATYTSFLRHFNTRYQLYGRSIRLVPVEAADRAAMAEGAAEAKVFAAFDFDRELDGYSSSSDAYFKDLARLRIVGITAQPRAFGAADLKKMDPYFWSYGLLGDDVQRAAGSLVCSSLRNRPAAHAGPEHKFSVRSFALLLEGSAESGLGRADVLKEALRGCGVPFREYQSDTSVRNRVDRAQDMRANGVTSVILMTSPSGTTGDMKGASAIGYQPEWISTGHGRVVNETQYQALAPPEQRVHMFGVGAFNRSNPPADEPAYWAAKEGDSENPQIDSGAKIDHFYHAYHSMLLLASGIQLAGPHLSPTTFAEGLRGAKFPNPGAGGPPYWQAHVGFGPGDYSMVNDVTAIWWSDAAPSYRSSQDAHSGWCYVNRGARYLPTRWPDIDDEFFKFERCR